MSASCLLPPLNEDMQWILGRPNFYCGNIASTLRQGGHEIPRKSEDEQAYVIHWMLIMYLTHGLSWREHANKILVDCCG